MTADGRPRFPIQTRLKSAGGGGVAGLAAVPGAQRMEVKAAGVRLGLSADRRGGYFFFGVTFLTGLPLLPTAAGAGISARGSSFMRLTASCWKIVKRPLTVE